MTLNDYLDRMLQDLQLRGMSKSTQDNYVRSVRKISEHYDKLPDQITEEDIREYFTAKGGSSTPRYRMPDTRLSMNWSMNSMNSHDNHGRHHPLPNPGEPRSKECSYAQLGR